MQQTSPVMPEMSGTAAPDDASSTLPTRPGVLLLEPDLVDLLAHETTRRRLPEGTRSGFAVLGGLVLLSALVGGLTGGLVVIGVSTLLAVSAALVTGHLSLTQVGGQRGANLLLGVGAAALILGSVVSQQARPAAELVSGTAVPTSSPSAVATPRPHAVSTPTPSRRAQPAVASASPTVAVEPGDETGLTLSPDALRPRPLQADVVPAKHRATPARPVPGRGNGKGKGKAIGADNGHGKGAGKGGQKPKAASTPKAAAKALAPSPVQSGLSALRSALDDLP